MDALEIKNPTKGDAKLFGKSVSSEKQKVKELINLSPQETAIAPNLTVKENLEFMAGVYSITNSKVKVKELISLFN